MAKLWIVQDQAGQARVMSEDPSTQMEQAGRHKASFVVPNGVLLSSLVTQLQPLERSMRGAQGTEAFIELVIGE